MTSVDKSGKKLTIVAEIWQRLPKIAESCQRMQKDAKLWQNLTNTNKSCQRRHCPLMYLFIPSTTPYHMTNFYVLTMAPGKNRPSPSALRPGGKSIFRPFSRKKEGNLFSASFPPFFPEKSALGKGSKKRAKFFTPFLYVWFLCYFFPAELNHSWTPTLPPKKREKKKEWTCQSPSSQTKKKTHTKTKAFGEHLQRATPETCDFWYI